MDQTHPGVHQMPQQTVNRYHILWFPPQYPGSYGDVELTFFRESNGFSRDEYNSIEKLGVSETIWIGNCDVLVARLK
jgi:hypothetical protein